MGKISAKQVCYMIAELFGCCCDYDPMGETMHINESKWCEKCDRNTPVGECWYRYFKIINKEREKSEID